MPSKTSKKPPSRTSLWKSELGCAEEKLLRIARELALVLKVGDRVFLEGEMGAGKTTFARALLFSLGVLQPPEGSPSFAIAHEYNSPRGNVVHVDFYRLKTESEIEDAGIGTYYWERDAFVISEWLSMFPNFEASVIQAASRTGARAWRVKLSFSKKLEAPSESLKRDLEISVG